jgi:hypothetical protein
VDNPFSVAWNWGLESEHHWDAWAPWVGRACISRCVREWRPRSWQKPPGPRTPFSASNDAEDGSFGPNRKIQEVISRFGPPPETAAPQPRLAPAPTRPQTGLALSRWGLARTLSLNGTTLVPYRRATSPPDCIKARCVALSSPSLTISLLPPSQQAHHESDWGIGLGLGWISFSRLTASVSWQHCHPFPLTPFF